MDPVEASSRWHRWVIGGTKSQVTQLFASLDVNLPTGWKRLTGADLVPFRPFVKQGSGWYAIGSTPDYIGVAVSLDLFKESELRGGRVWFDRPPSTVPAADPAATWDQVIRFLDEGIVPAAQRAGTYVQIPTAAETFLAELPFTVRDRLEAFSDFAGKSIPLNRRESEFWGEFVVAAFRSKAVIDPESFRNWLLARGWSQESANELNQRFLDQSLLLAQFADELSAV